MIVAGGYLKASSALVGFLADARPGKIGSRSLLPVLGWTYCVGASS